MTWVQIVLLVLKLANALFDFAKKQRYIEQGRDEEIARATAALLAKTEWAKGVREKIDAMDESAIDAALRDLEPR